MQFITIRISIFACLYFRFIKEDTLFSTVSPVPGEHLAQKTLKKLLLNISSKVFLGQLNACPVSSFHIRISFFKSWNSCSLAEEEESTIENKLKPSTRKFNGSSPAPREEAGRPPRLAPRLGSRGSWARDTTGSRGADPLSYWLSLGAWHVVPTNQEACVGPSEGRPENRGCSRLVEAARTGAEPSPLAGKRAEGAPARSASLCSPLARGPLPCGPPRG